MKPNRSKITLLNQKRRGSLLAKMVIVMSCLSILITLSGSLLFRLFRQQSDMTLDIVQTGTWARMARDFRTDVHNAKSVRPTGDNGDALELSVEDGTVTWLAAEESVRRIHRPSDSQTTIEETPGERYLCREAGARFSLSETDGRGSLAVLQVNPAEPSNGQVEARTLTVRAAVGLDRRFEGGTAE